MNWLSSDNAPLKNDSENVLSRVGVARQDPYTENSVQYTKNRSGQWSVF